jgi:hypothetical protein
MGGYSTLHVGRFALEKYAVPIVQEAECASGPVWTGTDTLVSTEVRTPHRPAAILTTLSRPPNVIAGKGEV